MVYISVMCDRVEHVLNGAGRESKKERGREREKGREGEISD